MQTNSQISDNLFKIVVCFDYYCKHVFNQSWLINVLMFKVEGQKCGVTSLIRNKTSIHIHWNVSRRQRTWREFCFCTLPTARVETWTRDWGMLQCVISFCLPPWTKEHVSMWSIRPCEDLSSSTRKSFSLLQNRGQNISSSRIQSCLESWKLANAGWWWRQDDVFREQDHLVFFVSRVNLNDWNTPRAHLRDFRENFGHLLPQHRITQSKLLHRISPQSHSRSKIKF